GW
uniref:Neuropeptide GWa n=1 Tax=Sepia officinalis TaxID=6610 RepID=GWA_SEPOF